VREQFATTHLRCPVCHRDRTMSLSAQARDGREIREGTLVCSACGARQTIHRGVGELLVEPPEHVAREAAGLEHFAELMRSDGWTADKIRSLPYIDDGYWFVQARSIEHLLATIDFAPGQWLLDIGSNTCWASNMFARHGCNVIALDISLWEMQGLWSSDYFIEPGLSYFERLLGSMNDMPIASGSLDYVYACEVLHHNDPQGLRRTFQEAFRVLRPGGQMLVVNETLKTTRDPHGVHAEAVARFEGYEHAHWAAQYRWEAIRAGFSTRVSQPRFHSFFAEPPPARRPPLLPWRGRLYDELRRSRLGRRLFLEWINNVAGGTAFCMIATKPAGAPTLGALARRLTDPRRLAARPG
jgi:SAM-dependent methyltransferase/uncharacterized protein YbaR (Trm112 family)